ncbi:hypothetical protein QJS10_CPA08g00600 [Acorus calamus]|uniref:RNase H type-1 domain-containing protein n=1 Tax=Acorus calamus TaxID=4465 RepID=A0AAV9EB37_ACOCL|nr:hypothetical protein QJS10_CPA08g00600 [Acorus calamus]
MSSTNAWKRIMHTKAWIMDCVRYVIFEGKSINVWHDPWLNGRGLKAALGRELLIWGPPLSTNLSVLIQNGKWTKPIRWHTALDPLWAEIQQLEVGGAVPDILIWPLSRSGIVAGLSLGVLRSFKRIWFETDSTTTLAWIRRKGTLPWTTLKLMRKFSLEVRRLEEWKISHIFREGNCLADILASQRQTMGEQLFFPNQTRGELEAALLSDRAGTSYHRIK